MTEQPAWVCSECGNKYGRGWPAGHVSAWHEDICGACGKRRSVTEPRDFRYLDMWAVERDKEEPKK